MKPFFSIIIPTYNRAHIIDRTIESVLAQTYTDWELIVVDDGSTDDTAIQMAKYNDLRIHYFQKAHAERSAARNYGLERATGKYTCFLDSDDEYLSNFLALHYSAILANPDYKIFRVGTYLVKNGERIPLPFPDPNWSALEAICRNFNSPGSYCFANEVIGDFKFDERFNIGEDFHFVMRLVNQLERVFFIYKYGYNYNYNQNTEILYNGTPDSIEIKLQSFEDLLDNYCWSDTILKQLQSRVIIVDLLIINLFFRRFSLNCFPNAIKSFYHLIQYPLLSLKIIMSLKFDKINYYSNTN